MVHVVFIVPFLVLSSICVRESLQLMMSQRRYSDHDDRQGVWSSEKMSSFAHRIQGLCEVQSR